MSLPAIRFEDFSSLVGGADYGEILFEQSQSCSIDWEDSRIEDMAFSRERGMALRYLRRAAKGVETRCGSAHALDLPTARRLAHRLRGEGKTSSASGFPALTAYRHPVTLDPGAVPMQDKIELMRRLDETVRGEFPHIRQVSLNYGERSKELALINSDCAFRRETRTAIILVIEVVAEKDGVLQTGHATLGGLKGYELLSQVSPVSAAREAARRAVAKLDAPKAKAGEMPVVLSSSAGGTFIHEAIGHSLEADHVQEGSSPAYHGRVGALVAPENITIIDDPTLPFHRGSFRYDDEGVEAKPTVLVENGMLKDYLYDRATAMKDGKPPNGHGRRESFHSRPIPRMSNLYIAPGKDDPREILRGLERGILVTRMGGGQVNTATGEFVFEVDEGFWVEDGVARHMVRDANLLGLGPDILKSIDRVGWDIGWGIGTCGKNGQGVPVSDGQPTLRIPKMLIGGRHA